ncbi:MAG: PEP-CTERM sorting domain-containing protein [Armatimonadetes bacterium]|nr:PEP-CTERM sorting domain-containing protein [Armatimonadota bacterium]
MLSTRTVTTLISLAIAASLSQSAAAQTAIHSAMGLGVLADANQNDGSQHSATYYAEQFGTLNPYSHALSVTDTSLSGNSGTLTVTSGASASWLNAGQGSVQWRNMGWVQNTATQTSAELNQFFAQGPVWGYTFAATSDGLFSMAYDVRATGRTFGLLGVSIQWSGDGGGIDLQNAFTPTVSGTFTRALTAGNTYTIGLANTGNIFTSSDPQNTFGRMDADFNWHINAVPEPSTVVGLVFAGVVLAARIFRFRRA